MIWIAVLPQSTARRPFFLPRSSGRDKTTNNGARGCSRGVYLTYICSRQGPLPVHRVGVQTARQTPAPSNVRQRVPHPSVEHRGRQVYARGTRFLTGGPNLKMNMLPYQFALVLCAQRTSDGFCCCCCCCCCCCAAACCLLYRLHK